MFVVAAQLLLLFGLTRHRRANDGWQQWPSSRQFERAKSRPNQTPNCRYVNIFCITAKTTNHPHPRLYMAPRILGAHTKSGGAKAHCLASEQALIA